MDPIVKLVKVILNKIPNEEFVKIKSVTGFVVLIVKIIEEAHRKQKINYDDSKKLVNLVIDTLIHTLKNINTPDEVISIVNYIENNRDEVKGYVNDSIDIWDALIPMFENCCGCIKRNKKYEKRHRKSIN